MSPLPAPLWEPIKIVHGVYRLDDGEGMAGYDRWWIQRLVESETGWMVHNDIYLEAPAQRYITVDVELSESWEWLYLNLRDDAGQLLTAEVEPGRVVVEWNSTIQEFPFDATSELDFLSPFMNTLTLRRLRLGPGQRATCSTLWFDPITFAPRLVTQQYQRSSDVLVELAGEYVAAQTIHFQHSDPPYEATLQVREDGLVLAYPTYATLELDDRASAGQGRMPPLDGRA